MEDNPESNFSLQTSLIAFLSILHILTFYTDKLSYTSFKKKLIVFFFIKSSDKQSNSELVQRACQAILLHYLVWFGLVWLFTFVLIACLLAKLIMKIASSGEAHETFATNTNTLNLFLNCCLTKHVVRRLIRKYMQEQGLNRIIRNLPGSMNRKKLPF